MTPILLPPASNPAWGRAREIVAALRAAGKSNPWIVAALANSLAESAWTAVIAGDHGKSFGPWQMNWRYFGDEILSETGIDIRTDASLSNQVSALLWVLSTKPFSKTLAALDAATTGARATAIFCQLFERASAADAVARRVAVAPAIDVWLAHEAA